MTGTPNQLQLAEQIMPLVDAEFARVASAFRAAAVSQPDAGRNETEAILAILEEKRAEVMANSKAGYFITEWRELSDQVRRLIAADSRYQTLKAGRDARIASSREAVPV